MRLVRAGYCKMPDLKHMTLVDCLYAGATLDASERAERKLARRDRPKPRPGGDE